MGELSGRYARGNVQGGMSCTLVDGFGGTKPKAKLIRRVDLRAQLTYDSCNVLVNIGVTNYETVWHGAHSTFAGLWIGLAVTVRVQRSTTPRQIIKSVQNNNI